MFVAIASGAPALSARVSVAGRRVGAGSSGVVRIAPRARSVSVFAAEWILRNTGPKSIEHLGDDDATIPGDLVLSDARMVVGRQASDSVSLEVPVPTVSGAHAMLEVSDAKVMVTDLSSTNGTFIEGEELQAGMAYELTEGAEVIFGDEFLASYTLAKM